MPSHSNSSDDRPGLMTLEKKVLQGVFPTIFTLLHEYCQTCLKVSPAYDNNVEDGMNVVTVTALKQFQYVARHPSRKEAKILAVRSCLEKEAPHLLKLFQEMVANKEASITASLPSQGFPGFDKLPARPRSSPNPSHPYSRVSAMRKILLDPVPSAGHQRSTTQLTTDRRHADQADLKSTPCRDSIVKQESSPAPSYPVSDIGHDLYPSQTPPNPGHPLAPSLSLDASERSAAPYEPFSPCRGDVIHVIREQIHRGEIRDPNHAIQRFLEFTGSPPCNVHVTESPINGFLATVSGGSKIYGTSQHQQPHLAKAFAIENALYKLAPELMYTLSPEVSSRIRNAELDSIMAEINSRISNGEIDSNESLLHEFVMRTYCTSVSFDVDQNERGEILVYAKVHAEIVGSGAHASLKTAKTLAIDNAIASLCPDLSQLPAPLSSEIRNAIISPRATSEPPTADQPGNSPRSLTDSASLRSTSSVPYSSGIARSPSAFIAVPDPTWGPSSPIGIEDAKLPDLRPPIPAVRNLIEGIEQCDIRSLSSLLALYLQHVEKTTPSFNVQPLPSGAFLCMISANGVPLGSGESHAKKQSKLVATQNVLKSLCPVLLACFMKNNATSIFENISQNP